MFGIRPGRKHHNTRNIDRNSTHIKQSRLTLVTSQPYIMYSSWIVPIIVTEFPSSLNQDVVPVKPCLALNRRSLTTQHSQSLSHSFSQSPPIQHQSYDTPRIIGTPQFPLIRRDWNASELTTPGQGKCPFPFRQILGTIICLI